MGVEARKRIENACFDQERALYHAQHTDVVNCVFAGPADGESVLKEASDIHISNCRFSLRYPLWHMDGFEMTASSMDEATRAPIWYARNGLISDSTIHGVKAVRECDHITIRNSRVSSQEFGWKSSGITLENVQIESEYIFLDGREIQLKDVKMKGKYSFQYIDGLVIEDSVLDTKDAFWHSKNVVVKNSVIKGEYLAWFSENVTLINCKISGTQPFCYCKGLQLIDCTMEGCDLAFEYSEVTATIQGKIDSVKNPKSGTITCDEVGEIIMEDSVMPCEGRVVIRGK